MCNFLYFSRYSWSLIAGVNLHTSITPPKQGLSSKRAVAISMQMENGKEGVHLTHFQFKEPFPDTKTLKQKRSGPKGPRQNVLNNKVPVKVMD